MELQNVMLEMRNLIISSKLRDERKVEESESIYTHNTRCT